jgi:transposase
VKLRTYCAMDLHHSHTVFEAQTAGGQVICHKDVLTERQPLIELAKSVPGPKGIALEEGPMADWAMRVLQPYSAEVIVCDPRRNRLIAEDGDKTDDIDAGKLIELYRLGSLRPIHHPCKQSMMDMRGWMWSYCDQVKLVVAAKNRLKAAFRAAGLQYSDGNIYNPTERVEWLAKLPRASVRDRVAEMYGNVDELIARRDRMHERLTRIARHHAVTRRFLAIPGYGPVRALTFLVVVDTPFRFTSPQKLWRYAGLGLRRKQSGDPDRVKKHPGHQYNRHLKEVARGATKIALFKSVVNPFQQMYQRLCTGGLREPLAELSVARKLIAVPWGIWKSGTDYNPALVGC